jgi:uridine phosphorylase
MYFSIYRKTTNTDKTNHYLSNHPFEQKTAAFRYFINRLISLPISQESRDMEWATILTMAKNNGFPEDIIRRLRTKLLTKKHKKNQPRKNLTKNG